MKEIKSAKDGNVKIFAISDGMSRDTKRYISDSLCTGQCQLLLDKNTLSSPLPVLDLSISGTRVLNGPVNGSSVCRVVQEEFLVNGTWAAGAGGGGNLTFATDKNLLKVGH